MTSSLNPKLLDFVVVPSTGEGSLKPLSGTVVEVYGPDSVLVEVSDENGVGRDFVTVPAHDAKVVWESVSRKPAPESGNDAQTLLEEGVLLLQNGLPASAKNRFAKSFGLDPNCARVLLNSTLELAKKGAFDSALFILRLIVELQPGYQLARENLAITHLNRGVRDAQRGAFDKALEDFTSALLVGQSPELINLARRNLAAVRTQIALKHVEIQRFDEALQLFLEAFQLEPSDDTKKNFALALVSRSAWKEEGRSPITDETFRQPMLMGLALSECLNAYGVTLARLGNVPRGRDLLKRALDVDPTNDLARRNLDILSSTVAPNIESLAMWTPFEAQPAVLPAIQ